MTTQTKKPSTDTPVVADPTKEAADRLAGLLPTEELEKALEGLAPDQITGPGGLVTQLAGRVMRLSGLLCVGPAARAHRRLRA